MSRQIGGRSGTPAAVALLAGGAAFFTSVLAPIIGRAYIVARARHRIVTDLALIEPVEAASSSEDRRRDLDSGSRPGAVLGAGLRRDGSPTALLARRVEAGARLYATGKVSHLVMSGDDNDGGNQPEAMRLLAIELGVPDEHIVLDLTGVDTAATCRRLRLGYPDRQVVLVTQEFHAHRTAYLAQKAGLDALVFASPDSEVRAKALLKARVREVPASVKAIGLDRFS